MKLNITMAGRRFYRSSTDAWIFGICGGLAKHFGWDPKLVRALTLFGTIAIPGISTLAVIVLYIALGVLVPSDDQA